jgi:hypothetical protein
MILIPSFHILIIATVWLRYVATLDEKSFMRWEEHKQVYVNDRDGGMLKDIGRNNTI